MPTLTEVAKTTQLWNLLSDRHQKMLTRIGELANELAAYEHPEDRIDHDNWEDWLQLFEGAARSHGRVPISEIEEHIELGYRHLLLATNQDIVAMEKSKSPNWIYGKEQIQEVLSEYDED